MAHDTASVFRDQRHRQSVGHAQGLNNKLFGMTAMWVQQEGQARYFTNGDFVGWAFWADTRTGQTSALAFISCSDSSDMSFSPSHFIASLLASLIRRQFSKPAIAIRKPKNKN